jgi:hypothetical protein
MSINDTGEVKGGIYRGEELLFYMIKKIIKQYYIGYFRR